MSVATRPRGGSGLGARVALGLTLGVALHAAALAADYRLAYLDGVQALRGGDAEKAASRLAAAIAERPEEQARARLVGVIPEPYLPHHYRGLALYALHRCPEALAEWTLSTRQGAVAGLAGNLAERRQPEANCRALAEAESALVEARQWLAGASPRATSEIDDVRAAIETATRELVAAEAAWNFAAVGEAAPRARAARDAAAALPRDRERTEVATTPSPTAASPPSTAGPAGAEAAPVGAPSPGERDRPSGTAAQRAEPAPTVAPGGSPAAESAPATAPAAALVVAAQAYFDGDYELALRLLVRPELAEDRGATFFVHLFAGAARHALYLLGGESDPDLLAAAGAEVRAARQARPGFAPAPRDFSPRFVAFYRATR